MTNWICRNLENTKLNKNPLTSFDIGAVSFQNNMVRM